MDSEGDFVIELVIDDLTAFLESERILNPTKYSPSVSIDGLEWNFCVKRSARDIRQQDHLIRLIVKVGFIQPDPSCSYVSRAAMFITTDPSHFESRYATKKEIMVCGKFSFGFDLWARRYHVINDVVVVKVHIAPIEKVCLSQPSSYTIRAPSVSHTNLAGIENAVKYPTVFMPYIDDRSETVIELRSCNPFMARSFKSDEFYVPLKIENPEGVENFDDYMSKQESQFGSDCNELVILNSHYPRHGGPAWLNFIQIRINPHRVTNRWLKFSQPLNRFPIRPGLAFTKVGWVIWHCEKTERSSDFRVRIWVLGETQVENVHDKVISLAIKSGYIPLFLFTVDTIYALGIEDVAVCALKDGCFQWVTYSLEPFLCRHYNARLLQWREDSLVLVDSHFENILDPYPRPPGIGPCITFIHEIKKVRLNGKEWYNVIPRFAIQNVPKWNGGGGWWFTAPMMMSNSLLVMSGPNDTITVSFLQPLSLYASALLVVEKQMAQYMMGTNWNGDRISLGRLTKEKLEILCREVRKWRYLKNC